MTTLGYYGILILEGLSLVALYEFGGWKCILIGIVLPMLVHGRVELGKLR